MRAIVRARDMTVRLRRSRYAESQAAPEGSPGPCRRSPQWGAGTDSGDQRPPPTPPCGGARGSGAAAYLIQWLLRSRLRGRGARRSHAFVMRVARRPRERGERRTCVTNEGQSVGSLRTNRGSREPTRAPGPATCHRRSSDECQFLPRGRRWNRRRYRSRRRCRFCRAGR